jgi:MOSC domain-containing protein YiiM
VDVDRGVTRQRADRTNRFLGVYADVMRPGQLQVGDVGSVRPAAPPTARHRVWSTVEKAATRQVQRLLEATVLREKH